MSDFESASYGCELVTNDTKKPPLNVINTPLPSYKSLEGQYFVGQTKTLTLSKTHNSWGGLINPHCSGINLFQNVYTITNLSETPFLAQIWFNAKIPGEKSVSDKVSPGNTTLHPLPHPKTELQYAKFTDELPICGINVLNRLVGPKGTLVSEDDGKWILPPGGSFIVYLVSPKTVPIKAQMAFGWWEEKICKDQ